MVDEHHANEDNQHAEAMEGEHGHAESAVLPRHAGGVVLTVGAALLARQAVAGGPLVCVGTVVCSFSLFPQPCPSREREERDESTHLTHLPLFVMSELQVAAAAQLKELNE